MIQAQQGIPYLRIEKIEDYRRMSIKKLGAKPNRF